MKKSFLFVAALALTFAACQPRTDVENSTIATFEEAAVSPAEPESVMHLAETGTFTSGNFEFTQEVSVSDWGTYYYGNVVTNKTSNEYKGDYQNDMSAKGGARAGKNFVVWTGSYTGADGIKLKKAAVVPGFYVCNTPWVVDAILNGDGMSTVAGGFGDDDWFLLTISGALEGKAVNTTVEFYLAKGKNYVADWTYVDLSKLGKVDELHFALTGTKANDYGLTTPAYFAFDDLGASK